MKRDIHRQKKQGDVKIKTVFSILLLTSVLAGVACALEPEQILVLANADVNESVQLAEYYCKARAVPSENILKIPLGKDLAEQISRHGYDSILASAIRNELEKNKKPGQIKCLLTLYGVPIKVAAAEPARNSELLVLKLTKISATLFTGSASGSSSFFGRQTPDEKCQCY